MKTIMKILKSSYAGHRMKIRSKNSLNIFSLLLRKYRFNNGISQKKLADELNVHVMTIMRWERETHFPTPIERKKIEDYINDKNVFLDPYELLLSEIKEMKERLEIFTDYLKKFHE